jgi:hypothetical protein
MAWMYPGVCASASSPSLAGQRLDQAHSGQLGAQPVAQAPYLAMGKRCPARQGQDEVVGVENLHGAAIVPSATKPATVTCFRKFTRLLQCNKKSLHCHRASL